MGDIDKEWSEDPADDPVELQKEQLKLGREFLDRLKRQEVIDKEREALAEVRPAAMGTLPAEVLKTPSFGEVSATIKKVWDEIERIMPTAPGEVKVRAYETLMYVATPRPYLE